MLLNWPATEMPNEVQLNQEYDEQTEIYFVGTLFKHLLEENIDEFRYQHILDKMIKINPTQRYNSFTEIVSDISSGILGEINFTEDQKEIYQSFADVLEHHINHYLDKYAPVNSVPETLSKMAELIRNSSLERYVQDNRQLINCFIVNGYNYNARRDIKVETVVDFYELVIGLLLVKQKILFDNIYTRLATIKVKIEPADDELPF